MSGGRQCSVYIVWLTISTVGIQSQYRTAKCEDTYNNFKKRAYVTARFKFKGEVTGL